MKRILLILGLAISMTAFNYSYAQIGQPVQHTFGPYGGQQGQSTNKQHPVKPVHPVTPVHPANSFDPLRK